MAVRNGKRSLKQMLTYFSASLGGTFSEWILFYILITWTPMDWQAATVISIAFGIFINWLVGRKFVFHTTGHVFRELAQVYCAGIVALVLNLLFMGMFTEMFGLDEMFSKVLSSLLVFFWNYLIRSWVIYHN